MSGELLQQVLAGIGCYYIFHCFAVRFGWWTGIHWGGASTEHPGWWKFRDLPTDQEYRKIGPRP